MTDIQLILLSGPILLCAGILTGILIARWYYKPKIIDQVHREHYEALRRHRDVLRDQLKRGIFE